MEPIQILLTIPGTPDFLRLARMAAADAASRVGFTYEEIDDLRIAVDELCFAVMGDEDDATPLELVYQIHPGAVGVSGSCAANGRASQPEQSELSRTIVAAVVDEHELGQRDGSRCFRLLKRGTAQEANARG
jgi:serine/threonine-protein kinase RsbW